MIYINHGREKDISSNQIFILECSGNIVLSSPNHNHIVTIQAASLQQKRRRRRIKRFEDSRILSFEYVDMTGNCLWSVWNKFRNGESFQVDQTGTHEPGWSIKAVKLL